MAQQKNLIVDQGSSWSVNVIAYASNSTGTFTANLYQFANGAAQIRKSYTSANSTANIFVNIHPSGSANNGTITLSMNNSVTGAITGGRYLYDVEIAGGPAVAGFSDGSENNKILRVCEGTITISPQITKWNWN
jgi:hypothetical protein